MSGPDWQTVVVTVIAAGALVVLVRPFVPARWGGRAGSPGSRGCPSCAASARCGSHTAHASRLPGVWVRQSSHRPAPPGAAAPDPPVETIDLVRPR